MTDEGYQPREIAQRFARDPVLFATTVLSAFASIGLVDDVLSWRSFAEHFIRWWTGVRAFLFSWVPFEMWTLTQDTLVIYVALFGALFRAAKLSGEAERKEIVRHWPSLLALMAVAVVVPYVVFDNWGEPLLNLPTPFREFAVGVFLLTPLLGGFVLLVQIPLETLFSEWKSTDPIKRNAASAILYAVGSTLVVSALAIAVCAQW